MGEICRTGSGVLPPGGGGPAGRQRGQSEGKTRLGTAGDVPGADRKHGGRRHRALGAIPAPGGGSEPESAEMSAGNASPRVLVTGANGFVGRYLIAHLQETSVSRIFAAVRPDAARAKQSAAGRWLETAVEIQPPAMG